MEAYRGIIPEMDLRRVLSRRGTSYWRHVAGHKRDRVLVLSLDGRPAGYVSFGNNRSRHVPAQAEIYELYVDPVCQGAGLGRRLFQAARERVSHARLNGIVVWALEANLRAGAFYRHCGGEIRAEDRIWFCGANYRRIAYLWR